MCRTVHSLLQTGICGIQMLVRVFMTIILMIENLIRMILQTLYNFISFMLQMISLIPICVVFLLTSRLKCLMCGGGGPCPVNRSGTCDCLMSAMAVVIVFLIFRSTGVLDKIFYKLGYVKTRPVVYSKFIQTTEDTTEYSKNDTDYDTGTTSTNRPLRYLRTPESGIGLPISTKVLEPDWDETLQTSTELEETSTQTDQLELYTSNNNLTTILYYIV